MWFSNNVIQLDFKTVRVNTIKKHAPNSLLPLAEFTNIDQINVVDSAAPNLIRAEFTCYSTGNIHKRALQ